MNHFVSPILYSVDNLLNVDTVDNIIKKYQLPFVEMVNDSASYDNNKKISIFSFNFDTKKIESSVPSRFYITKNLKNIHSLFCNGTIYGSSSVLTYNSKNNKFFYTSPDKLEKRFIFQKSFDDLTDLLKSEIDTAENYDLNFCRGFLTGCWFLRGGFYRLRGKEVLSIRGKKIDFIKKFLGEVETSMFMNRHKKEDDDNLLIIDDVDFFNFIQNNFSDGKYKVFPNWFFSSSLSFLTGFFYSLISNNGYVSQDKNQNYYLIIKVPKYHLEYIRNLILVRFNLNSRVIKESFISLKIENNRIKKTLLKYFDRNLTLENFNKSILDSISIPSKNEIVIFQKYKLIPWYKFSINKFPLRVQETYGLDIYKFDNLLLPSGFFVKC